MRGSATAPRNDSKRLLLRLGPCRVRIDFRGSQTREKAQDCFGPFVGPPDEGGEDFLVELLDGPSPRWGRDAGYQRKDLEDGFVLKSRFFLAKAELTKRRALIRGPAFPEGFQVLLRNLLPWLVAPGLVVHGALLRLEEGVVVCCGRSGAGKTTLAGLANGKALCDELALVYLDNSEGARGYALPFWQAKPGGGLLRAVLLLAHAPEHRLTPVSPTEAVQSLASHVLWPTYSRSAMAADFRALVELVRRVPVLEFGFRAEPSAYRYVVDAFPPERKRGAP